jgi:hypothetical protein
VNVNRIAKKCGIKSCRRGFYENKSASSTGPTQKAIAGLKRKIMESERCIAAHERQTRRPVAADLRSLASVSWSSWSTTALAGADTRAA